MGAALTVTGRTHCGLVVGRLLDKFTIESRLFGALHTIRRGPCGTAVCHRDHHHDLARTRISPTSTPLCHGTFRRRWIFTWSAHSKRLTG
jgi:hypothetical protein